MPFYETQTVRADPGGWSGAPTFSYQWLRDSAAITAVPLAFTAEPADVTVTEPATAQFAAAAVGSGAVAYQWQVSTDSGSTWTNIPGATKSTYTIPLTSTTLDENWYRAAATDDAATIYSASASLSVSAPSDVDQTVTGDQPGGFTVPDGQVWEISGDVTTDANVVVEGTLRMRGGASLTFEDVDEQGFLGSKDAPAQGYGPHDVVTEDVGLWVTSTGVLDAQGTPKTAWLRAAGALTATDTVITLESTPTGWNVGDELVIAPTQPLNVGQGFNAANRALMLEEERTITAISGADVTIDSPLTDDHPTYTFDDATELAAEVCNLTRDVKINGTEVGRSHVMIMSQHPVQLSYVELEWMGPSKNNANIIGRWALHMHKLADYSRGSLVDGCVVHRSSTHAFVPHGSHGVTLRDCIAHDVIEAPFWWDKPGAELIPQNDLSIAEYLAADDRTGGSLWLGCVASHVRASPSHKHSLNAFEMIEGLIGDPNVIRDSVAFGVYSQFSENQSSGFSWKSNAWDIFDCVAHHCTRAIFFWTNSAGLGDQIHRFYTYETVSLTVNGAYGNSMDYVDCRFEAVSSSPTFEAHSVGPGNQPGQQTHTGNTYKAAVGYAAVLFKQHIFPSTESTHFDTCKFMPGDGAVAALHLENAVQDAGNENDPLRSTASNWIELTAATFVLPAGVPRFWFDNDTREDDRVIWHINESTTQVLRRFDHPKGTLDANYNAKVYTPPVIPTLDAATAWWTPMEITNSVWTPTMHPSTPNYQQPVHVYGAPTETSDGTYQTVQFRTNQYAQAASWQGVYDPEAADFALVLLVKFTSTAGSETLYSHRVGSGNGLTVTRSGTAVDATFDAGASPVTATKTAAVGTSTIHRIAVRRSGSSLTVAVDGSTSAAATPAGSAKSTSNRVVFGGDQDAGGGNHDFYGAAWLKEAVWDDTQVTAVGDELLDYTTN